MYLSSLQRYSDWGKLLLRVVVAAIFLYHGSAKWGMWSMRTGAMPAGMLLLFKALSIIEPLAAIAVLLGLFTRPAALILAIVMVGAIYMKITVMHLDFAAQAGTGWEFDLMILAGCVVLTLEGAGMLSVDAKMKH